LVIAMVIISVGVLGIASVTARTAREMGEGAREVRASAAALSRFETLKSMGCGSLTVPSSGTNVGLGLTERWSIASSTGTNTAFPIIVMVDSLQYTTATGNTRTRVFTTLRSCP
jgi:hypothetical protein